MVSARSLIIPLIALLFGIAIGAPHRPRISEASIHKLPKEVYAGHDGKGKMNRNQKNHRNGPGNAMMPNMDGRNPYETINQARSYYKRPNPSQLGSHAFQGNYVGRPMSPSYAAAPRSGPSRPYGFAPSKQRGMNPNHPSIHRQSARPWKASSSNAGIKRPTNSFPIPTSRWAEEY